MRYYPVNLYVKNKKCLVVGGGEVGTRKVLTLLLCGAEVTVISPEVTEKLEILAVEGAVNIKKRGYQPGDCEGMFLIISAADHHETNQQVYYDANKLNILCNIADMPHACNFTLPSVINRGDLTITVSTSGKSPALSRKIRKELEKMFGNEYSKGLKLMGAIRRKLLSSGHDPEGHKYLFRTVIEKGIMDMIKDDDIERLNALLFEVFGQGYTFESLIESELWCE